MNRYLPLSILIPLIIVALAILEGDYFFHVGVPISCILALILAGEKSFRPWIWIIVAALIFCIAGDWMLQHQTGHPNRFVYGVILFSIAHIGYFIFCIKKGEISKAALFVLLTSFGTFFIFFLAPAIADKKVLIVVFFYVIFSCLTLAAAVGLKIHLLSKTLFVIGIVCFLFSDTLIALNIFVGNKDLYFLMMPTYYLSHFFITAGLIGKGKQKQIIA